MAFLTAEMLNHGNEKGEAAMSQNRQRSSKGVKKTFFESRFRPVKVWWKHHRKSICRILGKAGVAVAKIVIEKIIEQLIGKI